MKWICVEVRMEVNNSNYPRLVRILRFGEFFESYEKVKLNDPIDCSVIKVSTDSSATQCKLFHRAQNETLSMSHSEFTSGKFCQDILFFREATMSHTG